MSIGRHAQHALQDGAQDVVAVNINALRRQCDEALEPLLGVLDVIDAASSTLTEAENAIWELAGGSMDSDPNGQLLAELGEETRTIDLRLALGVVQRVASATI
jgi:hypothetical protein